MSIRYFALVYGIVFIVIGLAGFVPAFLAPYGPQHPDLAIETGAGLLFGLFPVNILHNLVHMAFGIWGVSVWRSPLRSRGYARAVAIIYGLFVVLGLIPVLRTFFGLVPLHGHDIWLHLVLAGVAAYFGWMARPEHPSEPDVTGTPPERPGH
ncbi:MAG: DUF4383 domain-containing protein [Pseudomonadales bacterium]